MKTSIIACSLVLSVSLLTAQNEKKQTTVRIKKVENINGVEKVTDTTYTSDDPSIMIPNDRNARIRVRSGKNNDKHAVFIIKSGDQADMKFEEMGSDEIRSLIVGPGKEEKAIIMNVGEEMSPEDEKLWNEKMAHAIRLRNNTASPDDMEGRTVIIKKPGKCGATQEEIDKAPVYLYATVIRKIYVTELADEDRKMLSGKPGAVADGRLNLEEVKFYPNPNNGRFNLTFNLANKGNAGINIMDIQGKSIYNETLPDFKGTYDKEVDISTNPKGVYFVRITQGNHSQLKKIVLE